MWGPNNNLESGAHRVDIPPTDAETRSVDESSLDLTIRVRSLRVLLLAEDRQVLKRLHGLLRATRVLLEVIPTTRAELREAADQDDGSHQVLLFCPTTPDRLLDEVSEIRSLVPSLPVVVLAHDRHADLGLEVIDRGARAFLLEGEITPNLVITTLMAAATGQHRLRRLHDAHRRANDSASRDPLTSLPNRSVFWRHLLGAVEACCDRRDRLGVLFIDLDGFKRVNDRFGHAAGDHLLQRVADVLRQHTRQTDLAARIGGDEFGVVISNLSQDTDAARIAEQILSALGGIGREDGLGLVTASIGIATCPRDGTDPDDLVKRADAAMYRAKRRGGARHEFHDGQITRLDDAGHMRMLLARDLRTATARGQFVLQYQPQFDLRLERVVSAEALVRWQPPARGLLGPDNFLGAAEEDGLIVPIGAWVLQQACRQAMAWQTAGQAPIRIAVNVSTMQLRDHSFVAAVRDVLDDSGIAPENLELEITESSLLADPKGTIAILHELHSLGVGLAIDDFGTGYSALSYLRDLPVDVLKIDRSFVQNLGRDPGSEIITEAIVRMAHGLHLTPVAEGVESFAQLSLLGAYGCNRIQGFIFGRPKDPDDLSAQLASPHIPWSVR